MKWSTLVSLLVAALGIGTLLCGGAHSLGSGLRDVPGRVDYLSGWSLIALDVFSVFLMVLSYFLYRGRNWARLVVMIGCIGYSIVAGVAGVLFGVWGSGFLDGAFITGILIWSIAGPIFLTLMLRRPEIIGDFGGRMPNQSAAANRRPAGQSDGSDNLSATVATDRAFPAAVAELGRWP